MFEIIFIFSKMSNIRDDTVWLSVPCQNNISGNYETFEVLVKFKDADHLEMSGDSQYDDIQHLLTAALHEKDATLEHWFIDDFPENIRFGRVGEVIHLDASNQPCSCESCK